MKRFVAAAGMVALAACATMPIGGVSTPSGPPSIPSNAIELGDYRTANEAAILQSFQQQIAGRYGAGTPISAATADLRRSEFSCGAAPPQDRGRGDPPAQLCRRTITANSCTHTWQVHLFSEAGASALARTRGLYDRRCGGDGLLGGPG